LSIPADKLADFAKEIVPQIDAEMKERQKSKPGRTSFVRADSPERNDHPGRDTPSKVRPPGYTPPQKIQHLGGRKKILRF
jgi:hypothetical protein